MAATVAELPKARPAKSSPPPLPAAPSEPDVDYYIGRDSRQFTPPAPPADIAEATFTVRQFEVIAELGMLPSRAELVDGKIITMPPTGNGHMLTRSNFNEVFVLAQWVRSNGRTVTSQDTHRFPSGWCPEPDVALCEGRPKQGALVDPPLKLVVEISFATRKYDLGEKSLRYAREDVPEYWVADLKDRVIRVFRQPDATATEVAAAWGETFVVRPGSNVAPLCLPNVQIDPNDVIAEAGYEDMDETKAD